jgi:RNA polymerase sigma-54 factor
MDVSRCNRTVFENTVQLRHQRQFGNRESRPFARELQSASAFAGARLSTRSPSGIRAVSTVTLQENLLEQVRTSVLMEDQRRIAEMIIGNIDDYGYLQSSVDELSFATNIRPERIYEVLKIIQTFFPTGIGARDLRECLLLQLERDGKQDTLEYRIIGECMEALGKRRIPEIARTLGTTVEEVRSAIARIANLEPRPGRVFLSGNNLE